MATKKDGILHFTYPKDGRGRSMRRSPKIWSLATVLEMYAAPYVRAMTALSTLHGALVQLRMIPHTPESLSSSLLEPIQKSLVDLCESFDKLETIASFAAAERLGRAMEQGSLDLRSMILMIEQVLPRHADELGSTLFYLLSKSEAVLYESKAPPFGPEVEVAFPQTSEDIVEAARCIAVARYTGAVFHLMRVLERGVASFAASLGIDQLDSRGKEKNWQNFLNEADAAIRKLPSHDERTKKYAAISVNLYNVKIAWRNETMHPKQTYTEEQAREVFAASRAFMREISSAILDARLS